MKKLICIIAIFCLILSMGVTAYADSIDNTDNLIPDPVDGVLVSDPELLEGYVLEDVQLLSLSPIVPSNTTGLKAVLLGVLGSYDAIVVQYQYQNNTNTAYLREIQPDYVWMASFLMLCLLIYCLFRIGGSLFAR